MGQQQSKPFYGRQVWVIAFQAGMKLCAVNDHAGLPVVGHLLQGEGVLDHVKTAIGHA